MKTLTVLTIFFLFALGMSIADIVMAVKYNASPTGGSLGIIVTASILGILTLALLAYIGYAIYSRMRYYRNLDRVSGGFAEYCIKDKECIEKVLNECMDDPVCRSNYIDIE